MNKRRLKVISNWLRAGAPHKKGLDGFDMGQSVGTSTDGSQCGTVACIGGAAVCFFEKGFNPAKDNVDAWELSSRAGPLLGFEEDSEDVEKLFYAGENQREYGPELGDITIEWAANCIDHLIKTGKVDWWTTKPQGAN